MKSRSSAQQISEHFADFLGEVPALRILKHADNQVYDFQFHDRHMITIDSASGDIWLDGIGPRNTTRLIEHLLYWLPGFLLGMKGALCFHGAAFAIDDKAILLLGSSATGKSTLLSFLAHQGYGILADDYSALWLEEEAFMVAPSYPWISLRPSSLELLGQSEQLDTAQVWSYYNESFVTLPLDQNSLRFQKRPLQLGAIYLLDPAQEEIEDPYVYTGDPRADLLQLISNAASTHLPHSQFQALELNILGDVLDRIPVRTLSYNLLAASLARLCTAILSDFDMIHGRSLSAIPQRGVQ